VDDAITSWRAAALGDDAELRVLLAERGSRFIEPMKTMFCR
jgi:hypothetical protein